MVRGDRPELFTSLLDETRPLADAFASDGKRLYLVGGIVRDALRGRQRPTLDIDLTTDALPDDIERLVRDARPKALWLQGKRFGTVGATFIGPDGTERAVEITTHRSDAYEGSSRKPTVAFSTSLTADLSRRDFTVNAMAIDAQLPREERVELLDPFGGADDLALGVLRTPVDPDISFSDDPLRMLRAARFVAAFSLQANEDLRDAVVRLRGRLSIVSAERIQDEFTKLVLLPHPGEGLRFLAKTGLLVEFLPELAALGTDDELCARTISALERCAPDITLRLCVLFVEGARSNSDAGDLGEHATSAARRIRALRFPGEVIDGVRELLRLRSTLVIPDTDRAVRVFVQETGNSREPLLRLVRLVGIGSASSPDPRAADTIAERVAALAAVEDLSMAPLLTGEDVMAELGVGEGRLVGEALQVLAAVRLERGPVSAAEARAIVRSWWITRASELSASSLASSSDHSSERPSTK